LVLTCCVSLMSTLVLRDMDELVLGRGAIGMVQLTLSDCNPRPE